MRAATAWGIAGGAAAIGLIAAGVLTSCASRGEGQAGLGPHGAFTKDLMNRLAPGVRGALDVSTQSTFTVRDGNTVRGIYDGTRLLKAADAHTYGTPVIFDATKDVQGDGRASFNEVRQVVRHFYATDDIQADTRRFEREVGIRWIPS